jgi:hypothetical protein
MTHAEIYQSIEPVIPKELLERYGHLTYGEMAEVPELSAWAPELRWAEEQWTRVTPQEAVFP